MTIQYNTIQTLLTLPKEGFSVTNYLKNYKGAEIRESSRVR